MRKKSYTNDENNKYRKKGYNIIEKYEGEDWKFYKSDNTVKQHLHESFTCKMLLREEHFLKKIKKGRLVGHVQCDIEVPENLCENSANFPTNLEKINVSRNDIGSLMKAYAGNETLLTQPTRLLTSICFFWRLEQSLHRCCSFFWIWDWFAKKYRLCSTIQQSASATFFQFAVKARREGDENPNFSVVAETMKILAYSSYGYQIMHRRQYTVIEYLSDEKTYGAAVTKSVSVWVI